MKKRIVLTLLVFAIAIQPVLTLARNQQQCAYFTNYNTETQRFDEFPSFEDPQGCYTIRELGTTFFFDGLLGFVPRLIDDEQSPFDGAVTFPLVSNIFQLLTTGTQYIVDPIFNWLSDFIPFWTYGSGNVTDYYVDNYTGWVHYEDYAISGNLFDNVWILENNPNWDESYWLPSYTRYIIYIEVDDIGGTGQYRYLYRSWLGDNLSRNRLSEEDLQEIFADLEEN